MSNTLTVTEVVNSVTVTPVINTVTVSATGLQGPKGDTGATGATGAQGSSGVVTVNAPLTNAGTSSAANLSVSTGTTSAVGVLQLTDSVSSTSTTTAATANAVKTAYDWATVKNPIIKMISPTYYRTPVSSVSANTITHQRVYYTPIYISEATTLDRIAIRTSSGFIGSTTVRIGIYNNTNGQPATVILDAGTVSVTASSTTYEITISQSLSAGIYWLAFCQQGSAPTTSSYVGAVASSTVPNSLIGFSTSSPNVNNVIGFIQSSVTGAFSTATSLSSTTDVAYTWIRVS
jgi:hypothetical protein